MSKNPLMNLLTLAKEIEAKAKPATVAARTEACERCGKRVPVGSLFHDDETEQAVCGSCPRAAAPVQRDPLDAIGRPAVRVIAERAAQAENELKALRAQLAEVTTERDNARNLLALAIDEANRLRRELAEARTDRAAEDRTAERVQVATDASAWHFNGPQGEGTADRIKAIGGVWRFHKRTERDQYRAAGFWVVPHGEASAELLRDLQASGRAISTKLL